MEIEEATLNSKASILKGLLLGRISLCLLGYMHHEIIATGMEV